jgi:hypothetical protein
VGCLIPHVDFYIKKMTSYIKIVSIFISPNKFIMKVHSTINVTMLITHHKYIFVYIFSQILKGITP